MPILKEKFGNLWEGEWNYPEASGIGIELTGVPNNQEHFLEILNNFCCHPVASLRILNDLMLLGERKVTVLFYLNVLGVRDELKKVGVNLKVIPPANHSTKGYFESSTLWDGEISNIVEGRKELKDVLKDMTPLEREIFMERYENYQLCIALTEVDKIV